ncbi:MAG: diguanylate cyclase, partial [Moraxellaceae bacterium]
IAGDDCLCKVARLLEGAASRPRDFVARYGGEEFVLVLPETDLEAARTVAERCRQVIEDARLPHADSAVAPIVTVSMGVGALVPTDAGTLPDFVNSVDRALYRAKRAGRNRVEAA